MVLEVNKTVRFLNSFTKVGRNTNKQISELSEACNGTIYQDRYLGKSLSLLQKRPNEDYFCHINEDGLNLVKKTKNINIGGFKVFSMKKKYLDRYGMSVETKIKQSVYNLRTKKIEEEAKKSCYLDGPSSLVVRSSGERQSEFPATVLGGTIHPAVAKKKVTPNGDTIYIEKYLEP